MLDSGQRSRRIKPSPCQGNVLKLVRASFGGLNMRTTDILEWPGKIALGLLNSSRKNAVITAVLLLALALPLIPSASADKTIDSVQTTHYTLVTEASTRGQHTG